MTHDEITRWLAGRAVPLDEPAPFRAALDGVRLAGLGEAMHGSAEFFSLRRRLTELLVRELGFTTLAIEAGAAAARAVDDHVRTGRGDARQVVAGLGFWTLDTAEMLAVVEWLREHNRTAERPVRFAGVDPQHPGAALRSLREHLEGRRTSCSARWTCWPGRGGGGTSRWGPRSSPRRGGWRSTSPSTALKRPARPPVSSARPPSCRAVPSPTPTRS
ncbi:erythromycin esterase family protein [Nonomuraea wenchangensis]|uniref:erythromycin esterase family protein n=1 Tax=Nonomuraea wenchangensis TaxID=568860 RepID=UPI00384CCE8C